MKTLTALPPGNWRGCWCEGRYSRMDELKAHGAMITQALEYLDMLSAMREEMAEICKEAAVK